MLILATYTWAFIKEIFFGTRLKDPYAGKSHDKRRYDDHPASGIISRLQRSRPMLAAVALAFMLSLFINYKTISKLVMLTRSEESTTSSGAQQTVREKPSRAGLPQQPAQPTKDETVEFLKQLYGIKQ